MWNVFSKRLNFTDDDIIAMTPANFSNLTNPSIPTSIYQGVSVYTRCVWEIYLGNLVTA